MGLTSAATRIMVVDDHDIVREGLRAVVEQQAACEVCCEAADGHEAVALAIAQAPDIVILDVGLPGLNGLDVARRIRKSTPETRILILTMHDSDEVLEEAFGAGVDGYVLKSDAGRELVAAIHALRQRRTFVSSGVAGSVVDGYLRRRPGEQTPATRGRLTSREREIVQLLAEGKSNKEVALLLNITVKTAETHRTNILRKLKIHSMADLVRYAIRNRIIDA